jgi:hypothetical protein
LCMIFSENRRPLFGIMHEPELSSRGDPRKDRRDESQTRTSSFG